MSETLENTTNHMIVCNIPADLCEKAKLPVVKGKQTLLHHDTGTGERKTRRVDRYYGSAIWFPPGAEVSVPEAAMEAPEVKKQLDMKALRKKKAKPKPAAQPKRRDRAEAESDKASS